MRFVAVRLFVNVQAVGVANAAADVAGDRSSVSQLRERITAMKAELAAVKKDPKTDCKTKDWQMQSLQRSIDALQNQVSAREAKKNAPVRADAPKASVGDPSRGRLVDVFA